MVQNNYDYKIIFKVYNYEGLIDSYMPLLQYYPLTKLRKASSTFIVETPSLLLIESLNLENRSVEIKQNVDTHVHMMEIEVHRYIGPVSG